MHTGKEFHRTYCIVSLTVISRTVLVQRNEGMLEGGDVLKVYIISAAEKLYDAMLCLLHNH